MTATDASQDAARTLNDVLDRSAAEHPDKPALVDSESRLSYRDFRTAVRRFARGLLDLGIGKNDHVGVLLPNRPEWFLATYAIERVGATMVGINTWYKTEELEHALKTADVSALITQESFLKNQYLERLVEIAPSLAASPTEAPNSSALPFLNEVIVRGDAPDWAIGWETVNARASNVAESRLDAARAEVAPDDDAYILFSSGTTGRPKPIVLQHDGLVTNARSIGERLSVTTEDRFWLGIPLFFSFAACNETITALSRGATLVLQRKFEADAALDVISDHDCTILYGMANMFRGMISADRDTAEAFSGARLGMVIGPETLRADLADEHGIDRVVSGYGLTEVCAICTLSAETDSREHRHTTVGPPLANVDVRIKDPETGAEVPIGMQGEIRLRSRTMFREYYKMPEKTRASFDNEGYFCTGDLGYLTPGGRLVFKDRLKDMIKTGGVNVSTREVTNTLEQHPEVQTAAVIPIPDEQKDELVGAIVRLLDGSTVTPEDLQAFCGERLASYKIPDVLYIRETQFPRTDTGKIRKVELREEYTE